MSNHNDKINQFDACVKKYLRRELKYRLRSITKHSKYNVNISNLSFVDQKKLVVTDTYPSERFSEKLTTRLFEVVIEDELLYEALLSIKPRARELIVLKYQNIKIWLSTVAIFICRKVIRDCLLIKDIQSKHSDVLLPAILRTKSKWSRA